MYTCASMHTQACTRRVGLLVVPGSRGAALLESTSRAIAQALSLFLSSLARLLVCRLPGPELVTCRHFGSRSASGRVVSHAAVALSRTPQWTLQPRTRKTTPGTRNLGADLRRSRISGFFEPGGRLEAWILDSCFLLDFSLPVRPGGPEQENWREAGSKRQRGDFVIPPWTVTLNADGKEIDGGRGTATIAFTSADGHDHN